MSKKILVWFRNDLRLHDNEVLVEALSKADEILPIYLFDPRHFDKTNYHTYKTGVNRASFLLESVASLRSSLQKLGGNLLVAKGTPEEILPQLVAQYHITEVYHHREVASEETTISTKVEDELWKLKVNLRHFIGHTLYNKEDLPFPVKDIPDVFTQFKKKTERDAEVKPCFSAPDTISFVAVEDWGTMPTLLSLYNTQEQQAPEQPSPFKGGEAEALQQLHKYLIAGEGMALATTAHKKHEIISKLSAWLALGCLSPREVYWKLKEAEAVHGITPCFNQMLEGLLWRDYYRFMFKKHGNTFFKEQGFGTKPPTAPLKNSKALENWKNGQTGQPLVNQAMAELQATGYINHVYRQLAAAYLVQELAVNWVLGAAYFEEQLIDYCPASNWGNWAAIAGVGNNPKQASNLQVEKLLKTLDPKGTLSKEIKA